MPRNERAIFAGGGGGVGWEETYQGWESRVWITCSWCNHIGYPCIAWFQVPHTMWMAAILEPFTPQKHPEPRTISKHGWCPEGWRNLQICLVKLFLCHCRYLNCMYQFLYRIHTLLFTIHPFSMFKLKYIHPIFYIIASFFYIRAL